MLIQYGKHNKKTVLGLFLDFEKAFDSVWLKGLVVKLFDKGIQKNLLKLIHGFLFKRKVRLKVNSYTGPCRKVGAYGLPQGSALSPFLFKFYIQDLIFTNQVSHLHSCNSEDISSINL